MPFSSVAVVPFVLGGFLAFRGGHAVAWSSVLIGAFCVLLITMACHLIGEVFDAQGDLLTLETGRTPFSGGTLLVANKEVRPSTALIVAGTFLVVAVLLGALITLPTRNWTLLCLGGIGVLSAILYSTPPIRLAYRGLGEILIAFCYGWLTLVTGYATATGRFEPLALQLVGLPLMCTIFNVIFLNEYPDYQPDKYVGKKNLVVRFGPATGTWIYGTVNFGTAVSVFLLWMVYRPHQPLYLLAVIPAIALSLWLAYRVTIKGDWTEIKTITPLCGLGIALNHLCSVTIAIIAYT